MHEASVAGSLLGIAMRSLAASGRERILLIEVSIGRLKAVEPSLVESCFKFMAEHTPCEEAELDIKVIPISACCEDCSALSEIKGYRFFCSSCGGHKMSVIGGRELLVDRIVAC